MGGFIQKLLFWSPRVLGILFALFLSFFAFDVFSEDYSAAEVVLAFLIHLIPTYIVLIVVYIAWNREDIGAISFFVMTLLYIFSSGEKTWTILAPLILIGSLFFIGHLARREAPQNDMRRQI